MEVLVTAPELNKLLENILQYADKKAIHLREVLFVATVKGIQAFSCDEYVAITDTCPAEGSIPAREFSLPIKEVEDLLEWVKKDKKVVHKSIIKIKFLKTLWKFYCDDYDGDFKADYAEPSWDRWNIVLDLLSEEQEESAAACFNLNPARLARLNALKADKDAPVAFRWISIHDTMVLQFKKGSTLVGAFQPIEDRFIQEEFLWTIQGHTEASPSSESTETAENSTD